MPTYKNDSTAQIPMENLAGNSELLQPGASIETYRQYTDARLTLTSATPYYNPLVARHAVTSIGPGNDQAVTITVASTLYIKVWKVTGGPVTIYGQSADNTPALAILRAGDSFIIASGKHYSQLICVFASAGTAEIIESREEVA